MAKIFKPRRGKKSTMAGTKKTTVLSAGEMFIEVPDTGAGTGHSKMKIGDGSTQYSSLPYAMGDTENDKIAFSNDTSGNITTALNKVTSGAALKTMIAALKQAVSLANTSITQLNDETNSIKAISYGTITATTQGTTTDIRNLYAINNVAYFQINGRFISDISPNETGHFQFSILPSAARYIPFYILQDGDTRIQMSLLNTNGLLRLVNNPVYNGEYFHWYGFYII